MGRIDYLLVDLPPGTGDVQLTLCQTYGLTAALVITTPQKLARVDVEKGIDMFKELNVPICGLIENMAYAKIRGTVWSTIHSGRRSSSPCASTRMLRPTMRGGCRLRRRSRGVR